MLQQSPGSYLARAGHNLGIDTQANQALPAHSGGILSGRTKGRETFCKRDGPTRPYKLSSHPHNLHWLEYKGNIYFIALQRTSSLQLRIPYMTAAVVPAGDMASMMSAVIVLFLVLNASSVTAPSELSAAHGKQATGSCWTVAACRFLEATQEDGIRYNLA